eukprot:scaffold674638_cov70-Prasinocladus_malaysianus.AAC.1
MAGIIEPHDWACFVLSCLATFRNSLSRAFFCLLEGLVFLPGFKASDAPPPSVTAAASASYVSYRHIVLSDKPYHCMHQTRDSRAQSATTPLSI